MGNVPGIKDFLYPPRALDEHRYIVTRKLGSGESACMTRPVLVAFGSHQLNRAVPCDSKGGPSGSMPFNLSN